MCNLKKRMKIKHSEEINLERWIVPYILRYDASKNDSYQGQFIYVVGDTKNQRGSGLETIKLVTDGDIIIDAIFTPTAKLNFFNRTKIFVESEMKWENNIFLIKTCKVEFNHKFRPILLIEEFTFQVKSTTLQRRRIKKCSGHIGLLQLSSKLKNKYRSKNLKNVHYTNWKAILPNVNTEFEIEDEIDDFLIPPKTLSILNNMYKSLNDNIGVLISSKNLNDVLEINKKVTNSSPNSFESTETIRDFLNCQLSQESKLSNLDLSNPINRMYLSYTKNNTPKNFSGGNENCLTELKSSANIKKRKMGMTNELYDEITNEQTIKKSMSKKKLFESTEHLHNKIIEWRKNSILEQGIESLEETHKISKNESIVEMGSGGSTILPSLSCDSMESYQLTEDSLDILQNYSTYLNKSKCKSDHLSSTPLKKTTIKEILVNKSTDPNKFSCNLKKMKMSKKKESWKSIFKVLNSLAENLDSSNKPNCKKRMEPVNNSVSSSTQIDCDSFKGTYTVTKGLSSFLMDNVHQLDVVPVIKNWKDCDKFNIFSPQRKRKDLRNCANKVNLSPILTEEFDFNEKLNIHSTENVIPADEISSEDCIPLSLDTNGNKIEHTESSSVILINDHDELSQRIHSSGNEEDVIFLGKIKTAKYTTLKLKRNVSDIDDNQSPSGNHKSQTVPVEVCNYSFSNSLPSYQIPGWHQLLFPEALQRNKSPNVSSISQNPSLPSLPKDAFFPTPKRLKIKECKAKKTKMYYNIRKELINMDLSNDIVKIINDIKESCNDD